jgi:hypothetical protein
MIPCFVIDGVVIPVGEKTSTPSPEVEPSLDQLAEFAARNQSTKKKVSE